MKCWSPASWNGSEALQHLSWLQLCLSLDAATHVPDCKCSPTVQAKTTPTTCQGHLCACFRLQQAGSGSGLVPGLPVVEHQGPSCPHQGLPTVYEGGQCVTGCRPPGGPEARVAAHNARSPGCPWLHCLSAAVPLVLIWLAWLASPQCEHFRLSAVCAEP